MKGKSKLFIYTAVLSIVFLGAIASSSSHNNKALAKKPKALKIEQSTNKSTPAPESSSDLQTAATEKKPNTVDTSVIHYQDKVLVLTYHHFDEKPSTFTTSPEVFHAQMQALKESHYHVISMEDFIDFLNMKKEVPPNAVLITIDDGYQSVYKYAYPELLKQGFTATTFLIVGSVGDKNHTPPFMNWDEIKEMKQNGFSFYSHTYDLHDEKPGENGEIVPVIANRIFRPELNRLETEAEYEIKVKSDLAKADDILSEKLGNQIKMLCFPHGAYTMKVMQLAKEDGIDYFFTGTEGINTVKNREINRVDCGVPWMNNIDKFIRKINRYH